MPKPENPGSQGKGKMKLDVCRWNPGKGEWVLKSLPARAAAAQVASGHAVYPVGGVCPTDPPTFEDDEDDE